jgi:hypothetical protein
MGPIRRPPSWSASKNLHTGSVEESRFPLWEEEGYRSGEGVIDPESIAADIWAWLIEPP